MVEENKKEMDKSISVKLPSELLEKARKKSKESGVGISFIVRKAIEDWVGNDKTQNESDGKLK